jgi:transcriptional regulator with XRE-family HTH domain
MVTPESRRRALREFLIERRLRLDRSDVGLPDQCGSRGLSQAAVAELAGISLNWYELLESGRGDRPISSHSIEAVARALLLDEPDKLEFYRLALPCSYAATRIAESMQDGSLASLRAVRNLARSIASATTLHEIATIVVESMHTLNKPDGATMAVLQAGSGTDGFAVGPRARHVRRPLYDLVWSQMSDLAADRVAVAQDTATSEDFLQRPVDVTIDAVGDRDETHLTKMRWTPDTYDELCGNLRTVSGYTLPLTRGNGVTGIVTMMWTRTRDVSRLEIETAKSVAAVVQLSTTDGAGHP